ncbi:MAG: amidohydrolase family protein, partial [Verrucomicrobiota bacterium]|nr:amidohydrolase family protein [Verrucomicrobiota bacterium]
MILRARQVVTMEAAPIENGAVVVEGSIITEVGRWSDLKRGRRGEVLDLGECALLPGLINAHCHLDYTGLRGTIPRPASFTSWIRDINERKAALSSEDYLRSIGEGFAEAARFGTTTILNLEAFPELLSSMPPPPLRTWWFPEFINFRTPCATGEIIEELGRALGREGWLGGFGLAPHAPYTASAKLY